MLGRDCPLELIGKGGDGGARAGAEEHRVETAGEGWRVRLEAAGQVGDCVGGQRRPVDLGGFEQQGQSDEEGDEDRGGEDEALRAGLPRARRRLVPAGGGGRGRGREERGFLGAGRRR